MNDRDIHFMFEKMRAAALLLVVAVVPVAAQTGGGGNGGGHGGIPLGGGGGGQSPSGADKAEARKNAAERPVRGVVTDGDGQPVTGAVVELKSTKTLETRLVSTGDKGEYTFTGLSKTVDYQIKATFKDHASEQHTLSTFDIRAQPVVNLQLK